HDLTLHDALPICRSSMRKTGVVTNTPLVSRHTGCVNQPEIRLVRGCGQLELHSHQIRLPLGSALSTTPVVITRPVSSNHYTTTPLLCILIITLFVDGVRTKS